MHSIHFVRTPPEEYVGETRDRCGGGAISNLVAGIPKQGAKLLPVFHPNQEPGLFHDFLLEMIKVCVGQRKREHRVKTRLSQSRKVRQVF